MECIILIGVGVAVGMYISSQIERHINNNINDLQKHKENTKRPYKK